MAFTQRLCREIIKDHFGPIVERSSRISPSFAHNSFLQKVANVLLNKGRLPCGAIALFAKLTQKQVRECLVVLIQHNIAYYAEIAERSRIVVYYEVSEEEILLRIRLGAILRYSGEWFGKEGALVAQHILRNELVLFTKAFTNMVRERFLVAVQAQDSISAKDRAINAEAAELEKLLMPPTAKELKNIRKLRDDRADAEYHSSVVIGMKRKLAESVGNQAKRHAPEVLEEVEEEFYFRINNDRYNIRFRNEVIVNYAVDRINRSAGIVTKTMLDHGEEKMRRTKEDKSPAVTAVQISQLIPATINLETDIVLESAEFTANSLPSKQQLVHEYLELLQTDSAGFLRKEDERGAGLYVVAFDKLRDHLKRKVLDSVVREKYGSASCRLMKILSEKGKLDEKQVRAIIVVMVGMSYFTTIVVRMALATRFVISLICVQKLALLPAKETRERLATLGTQGYLELQEVPKAADRAPSRTFYLWHVPLNQCYATLLVDLYRTLGNIRQRKRDEISARSRLLDKAQRQDVIENQALLSEEEQEHLRLLNETIAKLDVGELRIDGLITILRDI
ncbi:LOW QUALITY PROTEIN: RNA polymerase III subunit RPC82-domain-containing protein [Jimgerdemannia flammicorona]|uniref:DNA-directed RNA polymerase III subunit RPC3 n=1 Tax=Jimgerdemannia flammicorona TaxID=994334 RepID=A0A433QYJ3_9FUNG|nr:LOW QUALITY PROTEIN: RNA polymerase III subunit RPC82-domain-containing protein [Jimgerdemannia flammicorona]